MSMVPNRGLRRALQCAIICAAAALPGGEAGAAPPQGGAQTSSLSWSRLPGAESCIGPSELARQVEAILGRHVFVSAAAAEIAVEGHVAEVAPGGGWKATLVVSDSQGRILGNRELISPEPACRALDESVALAIALMIDPDAGSAPPPKPPPSQPAKPPPPPPKPEVIIKEKPIYVPVPTEQEPEEPWHFALRAGPVLGLGLLPSVGLGLHAAVTVEPPWFIAVEGSAAIYLPSAAEIDPAAGDFQLAYVGLAACPLSRRWDRVDFSLCAEVQLGRLWADGTDLDGQSWEDHQFVANLAARARFSVRLWGPLTVGAGVAGAVALVREPFEVRAADGRSAELFSLSPVQFQPDIAFGLRFL